MGKVFLLWLALCLPLGAQHAKNVVLFVGDAGGLATLNAASIVGHGQAQQLYIQSMPNIALSDTSTASQWVSDSAAGITAIVTGHKTQNGVLSQGPDAIRGTKDGVTLKTILEHAEERGLSTGVLTNMTFTDATPAGTYSHVNDRANFASIFRQFLDPRFGDGVDVLIGPGIDDVNERLADEGVTVAGLMKSSGRPLYDALEEIPGDTKRAVALFRKRDDFSLPRAVERAIDILSGNPNGFFLLVEGDMHTDNIESGLHRVLELDAIVRATARRLRDDNTLVLFTADHSFGLQIRGGKKDESVLDDESLQVQGGHTGEEVVVAAEGPGSELVRGYMPNTQVFHIMMQAYGWEEPVSDE